MSGFLSSFISIPVLHNVSDLKRPMKPVSLDLTRLVRTAWRHFEPVKFSLYKHWAHFWEKLQNLVYSMKPIVSTLLHIKWQWGFLPVAWHFDLWTLHCTGAWHFSVRTSQQWNPSSLMWVSTLISVAPGHLIA